MLPVLQLKMQKLLLLLPLLTYAYVVLDVVGVTYADAVHYKSNERKKRKKCRRVEKTVTNYY